MNPLHLERTQLLLTTPQFQLFFRLSKRYNWLGELYLELILSQEEIEYIYHSEINIFYIPNKDQKKRSPYLMR